MKRLKELRDRLSRLSVDKAVQKSISDNKDKIKEYQQEQLTQGVFTNGAKIGDYSNGYARWRRSKGLQVAHVDWKVTGALYRSIRVDVSASTTTIRATVSYADKLENKYTGGKAYGLTDKNISQFSKIYILPSLLKEIRLQLFK